MENQTIINDYKKLIIFVIKDMKLMRKIDELFDIGMVGFVKGINTYDKVMNIKYSTYLYACIKNEIMHQLSYEKREKRTKYKTVSLNALVGDKTELQDFIGYEVDYMEDYCNRESVEIMKFEMESLPYTDQLILNHLFGLNGYKQLGARTLSKLYGICEKTIYNKKAKFLRKVKGKLNEYGYI